MQHAPRLTHWSLIPAGLGFLLALCGFRAAPPPVPASQSPGRGGQELRVEGPFAHANLAVYVVRGRTTDPRDFITLQEGLSAGTVVVAEKGAGQGRDEAEVNRLEVENRSGKWLFLQAGDVVEGGKQDRTIAIDVTLAPNSPAQPVDAFCVERGRWRPADRDLAFAGNPAIVSGNSLKETIQGGSQPEVWAEVARQEAKALRTLAASGQARAPSLSPTGAYTAIAKNDALAQGRGAYRRALLPVLHEHSDAVGLVVAINGRITAADLYASASLFRKLARKLLDSYALEALVSRVPEKQMASAPERTKAAAFLAEASRGVAREERVTETISKRIRRAKGALLYEYVETPGGGPSGRPIHGSYLRRDER